MLLLVAGAAAVSFPRQLTAIRIPDHCLQPALRRRPRRLGGGKGGERRLHPMPPKDIKKQFVARLLERAIAEK